MNSQMALNSFFYIQYADIPVFHVMYYARRDINEGTKLDAFSVPYWTALRIHFYQYRKQLGVLHEIHASLGFPLQ